ncbi:hypothetical protein B566_EDAN006757 [Ephemera danica]|nr:hypothetical protein B566_EDAN006757 [Ephemera danica]
MTLTYSIQIVNVVRGVETENDSNDSLATHDSQSMDLSPSLKVNGEVNMAENKEPTPSTSEEGAGNLELEFRLPALKPNNSNDIEPPAGLSFLNVKQKMSAASSSFGHGYSVMKPKMRLKMGRKQGKSHRELSIDPFTIYNGRKLRRAVSTNNHEVVEKLLSAGVNPSCCDELGRSPLHLAACRGYTEILQMLLQKGADPNQKDSMGNTPLHLAACTNHVSVVTLLLKAGTDVHSSDHFGRSPLQLAQTRLRLLRHNAASNPDAWQVKAEVQKVIEMMLAYLNRFGAAEADAELLSSFSSRLTLTQTSQEVDQELRGLLASLSSLTIDKPGPS